MEVVQSRGGHHEGRGRNAHASLVQSLGQGMLGMLQPLLLASVTAERDRLARAKADGSAPAGAAEDLANLNIIAGDITVYERRWRVRFDGVLRAWPRPAAAGQTAFSLVSDVELQGQLIGQPVTEALSHRHADILDALEKRLWTLAAAMGAEQRPDNPFSPRELVDTFLETVSPTECGAGLRAALLRRFERLAGARLGEAYDWCNRQLAEAGIALAGTSDYAALAVTAVAGQRPAPHAARLQVWGADNALEPVRASWRGAGTDGLRAGESVRGTALRHAARTRRERDAPHRPAGMRELRNEEFLAVLSLLQVESTPLHGAGGTGHAGAAREALARAASSLGIDSSTARLSAEQEDAIDVVGGLFDALAAGHVLQPEARQLLACLMLPVLRMALEDPRLFEREQPPAMRLLARVVELWDGNDRTGGHEAQLHALADAAAREVVAEYHGDGSAVSGALERLESALAPLMRRASISERRAWQAIEGGERLEAARSAADHEYAARADGRPLLPAVATFLQEYWRQALVQAWLRAGAGPERFADVASLGDDLVRLDAAAADGEGAGVATALIQLQPKLHDCCAACGLDTPAAEAVIAKLVGELAMPDAARRLHDSTPMAKPAPTAGESGVFPCHELQPPRKLVYVGSEGPPRALRLAWRSPLSGAYLLVNAQGTREHLLDGAELAAMIADGRLLLRQPEDPVEAALQQLERG